MIEAERDWPWRPDDQVHTGQGWYVLARLVMVGLGLLTLTYALDIGGSWWAARRLATWVDDPNTFQLSQAQRVDTINQATSAVEHVLFLGTGVLFICWLFQAYSRPLPSPSALTLGRGWAIGGWFVPLANLVLPYRVIANLDRATSRATTRADRVIAWWWAAYIVFAILGVSGAVAASDPGSPGTQALDRLHTVEVIDMQHAMAAVVAAGLALLMVGRVTRRVRSAAVPVAG